MAATDEPQGPGPLAALMGAALALPIALIPARAGAAEVGLTVLGYKERGLMKVTEPVAWLKLPFAQTWELKASALVDIVSGASPQLVSNQTGRPVQTLTGASVSDRRYGGDVKLSKRIGEATVSLSRAISDEDDYVSRAFGFDLALELPGKLTTVTAAFGKSNDRVRSSDDPSLNERRDTKEYLVGVTQVLSPTALVQASLQASRGRGWFNDPYKLTLTFRPGGLPDLAFDSRPAERDALTWLTRYRHHFPEARGTLQADYRFFRDDWGIRSHTLEAAWQQELTAAWSLRPALRYYAQSKADFYAPEVPLPRPAEISSDQRLAAFGGLSPSLRAIWRNESGLSIEATVGYYYNAARLRPGGGSAEFEALRAVYVLGSITRTF